MNPPKRITDPTFVYTNSASTDLAKTFARVRRLMQEQAEREAALPANVQPLQATSRKKA